MIQEKENCDHKKMEIVNRENKKHLHKICTELKFLKSVEGHNRTYCRGVAAILESQLKKILRVYNYSYSCSEGLLELQNNRVQLLAEIGHLKRLYDENNFDAQA